MNRGSKLKLAALMAALIGTGSISVSQASVNADVKRVSIMQNSPNQDIININDGFKTEPVISDNKLSSSNKNSDIRTTSLSIGTLNIKDGGSYTARKNSDTTVTQKTTVGENSSEEAKQATLNNYGNFNAQGGLDNNKNGNITNENGAQFTVGQSEPQKNAELNNSGTITNKSSWTSNGTVNNKEGGNITNSGSFTANGKVENSGSIENSGSFSAAGNEVDNKGKLNNSNSFSAGSLKNSGKGVDKGITNSGSSFTVSGNVDNSGDFKNEEHGSVTVTGELQNSEGGTFTNSGNVQVDNKTNNEGTLNNDSGQMDLLGGLKNTGSVTTKESSVLNLGSTTLENAKKEDETDIKGTISNSGEIRAGSMNNSGDYTNKGTTTVTGKTTNNEGGQITNENGTFGTESLDNSGTVTNTGESSKYNATGKVTNNTDAEIKNEDGATFTAGAETENSGTITNGENSTFTAKGNVNNSGTLTNSGVFNANSEGENSLQNSGTLTNETNGSLNVAGDFTNTAKKGEDDNKGVTNKGNITVNGKTTNSGDITNDNQFNAQGSVDNSGSLTNSGTFVADNNIENKGNITNRGKLTADSLTNSGDITNSSTQENGFTVNGTLNNESEGTFTNDVSANLKAGSITNESSGKEKKKGFTNRGHITADSFTNKGSAENDSGADMTLTGDFINGDESGATESTYDNSGDITVSGDITNNATFTNENKEDITANVSSKNFNNNGTFKNNSGSVATDEDLNNKGKFENKGEGTVVVSGNLKNEKTDGKEDSGIFTNKNEVTVNGTTGVTNSGTFTNGTEDSEDRAHLTVQNGGFENKAEANTANNGQMDVLGSETGITNNGTFKNSSKGKITTGAGKSTNNGSFTNEGSYNGEAGAFENQSQGTLTNKGTFSSGTMTNEGTVTNDTDGTITVKGKTTNNSGKDGNGGINNQGTFNAEGGFEQKENGKVTNSNKFTVGTDDLTADLTNNGEIDNQKEWTTHGKTNNFGTLKNGTEADYQSDDTVTNSGSIDNSGTFNAENGVNNSGSIENKQNFTTKNGVENSGKLNNSGTFTVESGNFTNSGKDIDEGKGVTNSGTFSVDEGNFTNTGDFANNASGSLSVAGELQNQTDGNITNENGATVDVTDLVTNEGTITNNSTKTDENGGMHFLNGLNNSGTLTNSENADIEIEGTFSNTGNSSDGKGVNNSGNLTIQDLQNSGTFTNNESGTVTSNGTIINEETGSIQNSGQLSADSITNSGTFTNTDGDITTDGNFDNSGKYDVDGASSLTVGGTFTNSGKDDNKGFTNKGRVTLNGSEESSNSGKLDNEGGNFTVQNAKFSNTGDITNKDYEGKSGTMEFLQGLDTSGTVTNSGSDSETGITVTGDLNVNGSGVVNNENGSNFTVNGNVNNESQGQNEKSGINNQGTFNAQGNVNNSGTLTNSGTFTVESETENSGTITNTGENSKFNAKGKVTNNSDANIKNENGAAFTAETEIENSGTITNGENSTFTAKGDVNNSGTLTNSENANFDIEGLLTNSGNSEGKGLNNSGNLTIQDLQNSGTFTNNESGTVTLNETLTNEEAGSIENSGKLSAGSITNSGDITNQSKYLTDGFKVSGDLTNSGNGTLTNENASAVNVDGTVTNSSSGKDEKSGIDNKGIFNANGGLNNQAGGKVTNESGAEFNIGKDSEHKNLTNEGEIDNEGTVTAHGNITNSGTFTNTDGDITTDGNFDNSGKYDVDGASSLTVGGTFTNSGKDDNKGFTNKGRVTLNGSEESSNSGKLDNEGGNFTVQNAKFSNTGDITNKDYEGKSGTMEFLHGLDTSGTVTNSGSDSETGITVTGDLNVNNGGVVNNENGSKFTVNGDVNNYSRGKNGKSGIDNQGTFNAKGNVNNSGTLTNSGTFTVNNNVENKGNVTNSGNITVNGKTTNSGDITNNNQFKAEGDVNNSGTLTNTGTFTADKNVENTGNVKNSGNMTFSGNVTGSKENANITNTGILNLEGDASGYNGAFNQDSGTTNVGTDAKFFNGASNVSSGDINWSATDETASVDNLQMTGGNLNMKEGSRLTLGGSSYVNDNVKSDITEGTNLTVKSSAAVELGTDDKWDGDVNLAGGTLTLHDDLFADGKDNKGKLTATSGVLDLQVSDFTVKSSDSTVEKDVIVKLGSKEHNSNLHIKDGANFTIDDNDQWKNGILVLDDEVSTLNVEGKILENNNGGIDAQQGNVNFKTDSDFTINEKTKIGKGAKVDIQEDSNLTLKNNGTLTLDDEDTWNGNVNLNENGDLYYERIKEIEGTLKAAKDGNLHLMEGSIFTFKGDRSNIDEDANVDIQKGAQLKISDGATFNMNSGDTWAGLIDVEKGGKLNADNVDNTLYGGGITQQAGETVFSNNSNVSITDDNSSITGGKVTLKDNSRLTFGSGLKNEFHADDLVVQNSSTFSLLNGTVDSASAGQLEVEGEANFTVDVNQRAYQNDKFNFDDIKLAAGAGKGNINISEFNLLGDSPVDRNTALQLFTAPENMPADVEFTADDILKRTPSGWFGLNPIDGQAGYYNLYLAKYVPEEFRGQASVLGMYASQLQVNDIITNHFILHDQGLIDKAATANKYAAASPLFAPYQKTYKQGGIWSKSYASFDRMDLTQKLNVGNNIFGTLLGADLPAVELNNKWDFIPSGYIGYNWAHQYYDGVSNYQNGAQLGLMGTFIRNQDFITSITAYGGGYLNEMSYGSYNDNTENWFAGSALKTAYNIHPAKDFIIQPNAYVSYNAFGRQNWHSDYGNIDMMTKMFNGINAGPGINFILSKKSWSLYASFQYLFFMNDAVKGSIGNIQLPGVKLDHGVLSYGLGATKAFNDSFATYGQVNLYNAGITGVGLQFGLQWLFDMKSPLTYDKKVNMNLSTSQGQKSQKSQKTKQDNSYTYVVRKHIKS